MKASTGMLILAWSSPRSDSGAPATKTRSIEPTTLMRSVFGALKDLGELDQEQAPGEAIEAEQLPALLARLAERLGRGA